jgi:hypothetical protein
VRGRSIRRWSARSYGTMPARHVAAERLVAPDRRGVPAWRALLPALARAPTGDRPLHDRQNRGGPEGIRHPGAVDRVFCLNLGSTCPIVDHDVPSRAWPSPGVAPQAERRGSDVRALHVDRRDTTNSGLLCDHLFTASY